MVKSALLLLFLCSLTFVHAEENSIKKHETPLDNGVTLRIGVYIPSTGYGWNDKTYAEISQSNDVDMQAGMFFDVGSYFYLKRTENTRFGVGLNVGWLEFGWTSKTFQNNFAIAHLNINVLKVGPLLTMRIKETMGLDLFFQARPGFFSTGAGKADDLKVATGFDINWGTGINFRYKVFLFGIEYVFGYVNASEIDSESLFKQESVELKTNNLRFCFGFKF